MSVVLKLSKEDMMYSSTDKEISSFIFVKMDYVILCSYRIDGIMRLSIIGITLPKMKQSDT